MNVKNIIIILTLLTIVGIMLFIFGGNDKSQTNSNKFPERPQLDQEMVTDQPVSGTSAVLLDGEIDEYEELSFPDNTLNTSDWETYRNEEFGFEVRYPRGWKVREYKHPTRLFAFYHGRREGADNGIYVGIDHNGEFAYNPDVHTKVAVNDMYGYFASQGIPKTQFLEKGIVLKSNQAENSFIYSLYFFGDPLNVSDLEYDSVFEQMLLSFKLIK